MVEQVALTEERGHDPAAPIGVLSSQRIEHGRGQLESGRVQRNQKPLGQHRQLFARLGIAVVGQQPARQLRLVIGARPGVVFEAKVDPQPHVSARGFEGSEHQLALARTYGTVVAAVKEPDGRSAQRTCVLGGQRGHLLPALRLVAPEDAAGGNGYGRPAPGIEPRQLPCAIAAHRKAAEVSAFRVKVELGCLLVQRGHGHGQHLGVRPVKGQRTLRHHNHKRPALRVVAHRLGQPDLRLPHAFRAALAASVQKQNHRPGFTVVAAELFGKVNLKAVSNAAELNGAIEKACLLRRLRRMVSTHAGKRLRGHNRPGEQQAGSQNAQKSKHTEISSHYITRECRAEQVCPDGLSKLPGGMNFFIMD